MVAIKAKRGRIVTNLAIEPKEELSDRQAVFVERYLESYNANRAAEQSGYAFGYGQALMRMPAVRKAINEAMASAGMKPVEIIARLSRIARTDMEEFLDVDENGYARVNLKKAKAMGKLGLLQEISYDNNGMPRIKLQSQLDAMEKLAKINAMFTEKLEVSITGQVDINVNKQVMVQALADPALLAKLGELAEQVASKGAMQAQLPSVEVVGEVVPTDLPETP